MPNRGIKESICMSKSLADLNDGAEVLFYRLIVNCDDFGRTFADPIIVLAKCYARQKSNEVTTLDIEKRLNELVRVGIIIIYKNDDETYLQFTKWGKHQRGRATKSKYPGPYEMGSQLLAQDNNCSQLLTDDNGCSQVTTSDNNCSQVLTDDNGCSQVTTSDNNCSQLLTDVAVLVLDNVHEHAQDEKQTSTDFSNDFESFWKEYPRHDEKKKAWSKWKATLNKGVPVEILITAAKNYATSVKEKDKRYIKLAGTFLGPDEHYKEYFAVHLAENPVQNKSPAVRDLPEISLDGIDMSGMELS